MAGTVNSMEQAGRSPKLNRILANIGKFAIDSAIIRSLKGASGRSQLHKIVQEKLQDVRTPPTPKSSTKKVKPDHALVAEEFEEKMEAMRGEVNGTKLQSIASSCLNVNKAGSFKIPPEDSKEAGPLRTNKKKIMIRSRL